MNRKQKLKNAVILGLLMSSVTASSSWAESLVVNHIIDDNANVTAGNPIYGIWGYKYFKWGTVGYEPYDNKYESINITVKNNYYSDILDPYCGDEAIGIGDADDSGVNLESKSGISVNVETRNAQNGYGINASHGKEINLSAQNDIYIDVKKTNGINEGSDVNPVYENSQVYGIYSDNNSGVKLTSQAGSINIEAYYDKEAADSNNKLKLGDIYGISNTSGTVDLTAGNNISITANSANGNAYGIYTNSNKDTKLNGNVNITAVADETGNAYGIYAENGTKVNIGKDDGINVIKAQAKKDYYSAYGIYADDGSKVDISGDTYVHGDNGAIVIIGNGINNNADGESEKQFTADGNLFVSADNGTVITIDNGASEHVKGNLISVSGDENNTFSNVSLNGSSLTVDRYAVIQGGKIGLELNNSTVTFGKEDNDSGPFANYIIAKGENSIAVDVKEGSTFTSNGSVTASGGQYGFKVATNGAKITINAGENGINLIKANE